MESLQAFAHPTYKTACFVCGDGVYCKGLCLKHYRLVPYIRESNLKSKEKSRRRKGILPREEHLERRRAAGYGKKNRKCSLCDQKHFGNGFCRLHHSQQDHVKRQMHERYEKRKSLFPLKGRTPKDLKPPCTECNDGSLSYCKGLCKRHYVRQKARVYAARNREKMRLRREKYPPGFWDESARRSREKRAVAFSAYKLERGCSRCGYNKFAGSLDFHHVNPSQKKFLIQADGWSAKGQPLGRTVEELKKCILLCKNCHYEVHDEMRRKARGRG